MQTQTKLQWLVQQFQATICILGEDSWMRIHGSKPTELQWKALMEKKEGEEPEVPTITKSLPIIKWSEAFQDFLNYKVGHHNNPLAYVNHVEVMLPPIAPLLCWGSHTPQNMAQWKQS